MLASCEPPSEGGTAGTEAGPSLETARGELIDCNGLGPNPPAISLTSPASGATLSGTVTLTVDATDDEGVMRVSFYVDGRLLVTDNTPPFELVWNTATHGNGLALLTAVASDTRCQATTSAPVGVTIENAGIAAYDPTWSAPACATAGSRCDSADLLSRRGPTLDEAHQPNTVGGSCVDGTAGITGYSSGPWLERLVVSRIDGTPFAAGKEVTVQATVMPSSGFYDESLDLYVAADPANPTWTLVATLFPSYSPGNPSTLSATYLMPLSGRHVLRGVYRTNGRSTAPSPCIPLPSGGAGGDDHDDLVITVGPETDTTPPAVAITSPVSGATLERFVHVTMEASDHFGLHRVELYDGATLLATYSRPPFSFSWATRTVPNGAHTLTARAYDLTGNVTTSAPVNVVINNDYVPPQVALLQPGEGTTVMGTVPLEASASDDRGPVRVEFSVDGRLIGTRDSPPFTLSWNSRLQNSPGGASSGVLNGAHVLSVTAYDLGGNPSTSSSVNVIVDNDYTAPSEATLTSPASGALLSGLVTLEATASDDRGIAEVLFYVDSRLIGSDTTAPYSLSWDSTEVSNGGHKLSIRARDTGANSKSSAEVTVQTSNAGNVRFDTSLLVPQCDTVAARCDSRELLLGRGGQEKNTPNTLDGCVDGNAFEYSDQKHEVNRIRVIREDGTALAAGKRVRIEVDVRTGYVPADTLTLYHSANAARGASFTQFASLQPTQGVGPYQTLSAELVLPAGSLQAIRARMTSNVNTTLCQAANNSTDRDDLVFAVAQEADTTPPSSVVLTSPANGATVTTSVTLTAVASDDFGVAAMDFYDGTTLIGTDTSAPFSVVWNSRNGPNGSRTLTARARDLAGNATVSAPVTVTASNDLSAPVVAITSPSDGARLATYVDIAASASDPEGVTKVEFYNGTQLLGTATSAPYTYRFYQPNAQTRSYALTAKAYDAAGNVGTSAQVVVTLAVELEPPVVSLTSPTSGARLSKTVSLSAEATDNQGMVSRVEFLLDGAVVIGSDTSAPFTFSWNTQTAASGNHTLSARATDPAGNQADSAAVSVTLDNAGPAVALTSPASGATVGSVVTLQASASDDAGVARVEFLVDGLLVGSDTTAPYSVAWDSSSWTNGSHTLSARAYDSLNNVATSAAVPVTTKQPTTTVALTSPTHNAYVKGLVPLNATATDDQGVVKVEFYVDGTLLGTDTTAPYELSWDSTQVADGAYTFSAKAYGPLGIPATSLPATVKVDNNAPAVALASPAPGAFLRRTVTLSATASDTLGVARVEFYDGATLLGTFTTAPYAMSWNTANTTGGAHTLTVKAMDDAGNVTTSAAVAVTVDNTAPTAALSAPAQSAYVRGTVAFSATASDNQGVARVEFYAGDTLIGTDTSAPYELSWNSVLLADGYYTLRARAYDSAGNSGSAAIVVTLDNTPPDVALTSPAPGAFVRGTVLLDAIASDNNGMKRVEFYVDGTLVDSDINSNYQGAWYTTGVANGAHTLMAKAIDGAGNERTSAEVTVTVDNTAPTTALSTPAQGASVRGIVAISATASDNLGVDRVEFYAGTTLLGTSTTAPYGVSWDTTALTSGSTVTLTTKAYDAAGHVTTSAARTVTVDNVAPTVAITSPANGASFSGLTFSTNIQASASDNRGVTQVVFYDGGSVIGTDTTAPYSVSWNLLGTPKGTHTLTARAYDAAGNVTTSAPISVKVN
ncbi:Fibronectin type III domain protein [Archangium gephyra]|uniref:Fibronectin type III domain protein n=1 Tax=Archangium gephyra TaxID=48 RepID=A0AAC8TFE6_9BACT|nr:Fibronectin type III domain protein [Archangium gephyra]